MVNVTLANNSALGVVDRDGLWLRDGDVIIRNSLFSAGGLTNCTIDGGSFEGTATNLSDDPTCPDFDVNVNLLLGGLGDYGGGVLSHGLLAGSPAIDSGDDTYCAASDVRGVARPQDGDEDGTAVCDIGAVEAVCSVVVLNNNSSGVGSLRERMVQVCDGGRVTFDPSLSGATIGVSADGTLQIDKPLTIHGNVPVVVSGNGAVRVFQVTSSATAVSIEGIDIVNGRAAGFEGGGLMVEAGAAVTLTGSALVNNRANYGGGAYVYGTLTILTSTVTQNTADLDGAGIYNDGGTLVVRGSTVSENNASAAGSGGGIFNRQGTMAVSHSSLAGNVAAVRGGGIASDQGVVEIESTTLRGNRAADFGGGIASSGMMTVSNSTLSGNEATGSVAHTSGGGAIYQEDGGSEMRLIHATITGNSAANVPDRDGVWLVDGALFMRNSVVAENGGKNCTIDGGYFDGGTTPNFADDGSCPNFLQVGDVMLGVLGSNGGGTQTRLPLPNSPLIDGADPADCLALGQRGVARPQDGDRDGFTGCDVGAVELAGLTRDVTLNGDGSATVAYTSGAGYTLYRSTTPYSGFVSVDTSGSFVESGATAATTYWQIRWSDGTTVDHFGIFSFALTP